MFLFKAWRQRTSIYKYDVRSDQRYDFPDSSTSRVPARLVNGGLDIPPRTQAGSVVLLELRIRATPLGHWLEPYVEIESARGRNAASADRSPPQDMRSVRRSVLSAARCGS